ncbi:hypothetical protein [Janthinobacterium sp. PC23-8]|uniref:hypothetical protein n=1 Tax=Janthinobacterium sp. PC23-8 TaxID=2012679 RepID=UPI000B95CDF4|nr:hypothetical protein [Janthinobacterium sp. PC23-8]OYO27859.1 hypothetical protein CD932_22355 [Janthinobacterium sp. PC23-8]
MNTTSVDYRRFLLALCACLACGALATIALVVIVDPYGLYKVVDRPGFNAVKPGLSRYQVQIKQAHALRLRPRVVILGNSRAEIGFDPAAPALAGARGAVYNLAIPGTGLATANHQLGQLLAAGVKPETVILGVEFMDFLALKSPSRPSAKPAGALDWQAPWQFDALFSLASVKDALQTLRIEHDAQAATLSPDGFNPLREYAAHVRNDGYHKMFEQRARENAATLTRKSTTSLDAADFTLLRTLLTQASASDASVKLVIYPYHAQWLAMLEAAGFWPLFEQWKAQLVREIASIQASHPGASIALHDFSGYGPYNCERIPAASERDAATRWYWEAGHFKKELGDVVLERLLSPASVPPLGLRLDAGALAANTRRIASERRDCLAFQPELFLTAAKMSAPRDVKHVEKTLRQDYKNPKEKT